MSGKIVQLRQAKIVRNATSRSKGRRGNGAYRRIELFCLEQIDAARLPDNPSTNVMSNLLAADRITEIVQNEIVHATLQYSHLSALFSKRVLGRHLVADKLQ